MGWDDDPIQELGSIRKVVLNGRVAEALQKISREEYGQDEKSFDHLLVTSLSDAKMLGSIKKKVNDIMLVENFIPRWWNVASTEIIEAIDTYFNNLKEEIEGHRK